jgi:hypothetical protein
MLPEQTNSSRLRGGGVGSLRTASSFPPSASIHCRRRSRDPANSAAGPALVASVRAGTYACGMTSTRPRFPALRVLPFALTLACASGPSAATRVDRVPVGLWGGEHVRLTVEDAGAVVEFDCAHGRVDEALALDDRGRFDVKGHYVREGGPARQGEKEDARPVRYQGQTDGRRMTLEVVFDSGEKTGSFHLGKDERGRLVKCL